MAKARLLPSFCAASACPYIHSCCMCTPQTCHFDVRDLPSPFRLGSYDGGQRLAIISRQAWLAGINKCALSHFVCPEPVYMQAEIRSLSGFYLLIHLFLLLSFSFFCGLSTFQNFRCICNDSIQNRHTCGSSPCSNNLFCVYVCVLSDLNQLNA